MADQQPQETDRANPVVKLQGWLQTYRTRLGAVRPEDPTAHYKVQQNYLPNILESLTQLLIVSLETSQQANAFATTALDVAQSTRIGESLVQLRVLFYRLDGSLRARGLPEDDEALQLLSAIDDVFDLIDPDQVMLTDVLGEAGDGEVAPAEVEATGAVASTPPPAAVAPVVDSAVELTINPVVEPTN